MSDFRGKKVRRVEGWGNGIVKRHSIAQEGDRSVLAGVVSGVEECGIDDVL